MRRRIADWWDTHKEADARRVSEEEKRARRAAAYRSAMDKLTHEEIAALGLRVPTETEQGE